MRVACFGFLASGAAARRDARATSGPSASFGQTVTDGCLEQGATLRCLAGEVSRTCPIPSTSC